MNLDAGVRTTADQNFYMRNQRKRDENTLRVSTGWRCRSVLIVRLAGGAIVDGIFGAVTASAVRNLQRRYRTPVTGRVNPTTWEVLDMHENLYRSPLPWKQQNVAQPQITGDF